MKAFVTTDHPIDRTLIIDHFPDTANAARHGYDSPQRSVLERKDSRE
jgi:hypothetical protein